jgi:nicotinamide riboside kinase
MVRRINLFGAAGTGKSTLAAKIFAALKEKHHDVELITEYIKPWAYEGRKAKSYDSLYVFSKQVKAEDTILRSVNAIVTDSPVLLNAAYGVYYKFPAAEELVGISKKFDIQYPVLNLRIERTVKYVQKGRYESKDEAHTFDEFLFQFLNDHASDFHDVKVKNFSSIIKLIERHLDVSKNS